MNHHPTPIAKAIAATTIIAICAYYLNLAIWQPLAITLTITAIAMALIGDQEGGEKILLSLLFQKRSRQLTHPTIDTTDDEDDEDELQTNPSPTITTNITTPTTQQEIPIKYFTRSQIEQACDISPNSSQISQWKKMVDELWEYGENFTATPYNYASTNGELQFTNEALQKIAPKLSTKNQKNIQTLLS